MRTSTTLFLALATLALGVWLLLAERPADRNKVRAPLLDAKPEEIQSIRIERADEVVLLERSANHATRWRITAPRAERADNRRVGALIDTLSRARPTRSLPDSMEEAGDLARPRARLEFTSNDGTVAAVEIGRTAPLGESAYIRTPAHGIVLAPADAAFAANRGFDDLRERQLLEPLSGVETILLTRPGLPDFRLAREADGWRITDPLDAPADQARISTWLERVNGLRAERFLDDPDPAEFTRAGFDAPALTIRLRGAAGERTIALGRSDPGAESPAGWVRIDTEPRLASVAQEGLRGIDVSPEQLRDRRVLRLDPADFATIELRRPGTDTLALQRDGERWTSPDSTLDSSSLERFVADLADLRSEVDPVPPGGLPSTPPSFSVEIAGKLGQQLAVLDFAEAADAVFTVRSRPDGQQFVIGPHAWARLDKRAENLR